jgi:hypothetical protein
MEGNDKRYDVYWEGLRFAYHQIARDCPTEADFISNMYMIGVLPGTPEFAEAKRAWVRFQRVKRENL